MELSERIKQYRRERGYSQEQVARKLHITQGAVSQWELGLTAPNAQQVGALADLLGTTADELLGREKPEPPKPPALDNAIVSILLTLSPAQLQRVMDFVAGMKASETK